MYIDKDHSQFLLQGLSILRQNEELCDVELRVGDSSVFAHKVVLAAVSEYFKAMFTGRMEESLIRIVNLNDIDEKSISLLIDFAYTGKISFSVHNVQMLLVTANMLGVTKIVDICCDFLTKQLHPSNCLGFLDFADTHSLKSLKLVCLNFTLENFSEIIHYDEYLHLNPKLLHQIICSDNLNVVTEEDVFLFLEQWVLHSPNERISIFYKLFSELRLLQLSMNFLKSLHTHSFISSPDGYALQLKINQILNIKTNPYRLLDEDLVKKPSRRRSSNKLMVIGGKSGLLKTLDSCSIYDAKTNVWKMCKDLPLPRIDASATSVNGELFITGGMTYEQSSRQNSSTRACTRSVLCFSVSANTWTPVPEMVVRRSSHACVSHDGNVYAIGGYDGKSCLQSAECYNLKTKTWSMIADMKYSRSSFSAISLEEYVYVLGGQGTAHLCTVERYDTKSQKWDMMPSMSTKRINFGAAQLHGFIFVLGGHDGQDYLRSVERFDPILSEWTVVSPLPSPRTGIGVTVLQNQIFVLGGHDGNRYLDCSYRYDPCKDKWFKTKNMLNARCYMAIANVWTPGED